MLATLLLIIHIVVAVLMCIVILMQSTKGEGLSGAFGMGQGTSTFFGADTANVLVKITTVLAVIFMLTSLSLAYIQAQRARSVTEKKAPVTATEDAAMVAPTEGTIEQPEGEATTDTGEAVEPEADETTEEDAPSADEPETGDPVEPSPGEPEEEPNTES